MLVRGGRLDGAETRRRCSGPNRSSLGDLEGDGPAVVNAGGWGVYRTGYGSAQLAELGRAGAAGAARASQPVLTTPGRSCSAGHVSLGEFLALGARLGHDDEPSTFSTLAGALALCDRVDRRGRPPGRWPPPPAPLLGARAESLGWEPDAGEGERTPSLRALLVSVLGTLGEDEADPPRGPGPLRRGPWAAGRPRPDLESAVLDVVADAGRAADYEAFLARYRAPKTPQEEQRYLRALARFPDEGSPSGPSTWRFARCARRTPPT